jgi:pentatricopeptide repeat protein
MVTMYEQTEDPQIMPSSISYNTLMNAWGKTMDPSAPEMVEKVLQQMIAWNAEDMKPDALTFSTMMDAYSRSKDKDCTQRAEELFQMMDTLRVKRNVFTFSALQNVYARSGRSDAPEKSMEVLQRMLDLFASGDVFAKPNCVNYNTVLNAYSRTQSKESAYQADQMLQKMELPVVDGGFDIEPDRLSYALTILACARCPDEIYGARISEKNLAKMEARAQTEADKRAEVSSAAPPAVTLDIECFNVVLTAISKSRQEDAVARTMAIVTRMDEHVQTGHDHIRPNIRSWNAVLNSLSRSSRDANSTTKAEQILTHIFDMYKGGMSSVKPDAFSYAAVLSAYQRSDDPSAAQRADDLITRMEELHETGDLATPPDVYHYTIVCATWAKSRQREGPNRVVQILAHMKDRHAAGFPDVKPNVRTYNAVLDCLSRSKEDEKAEQVLYHMLALSKNGDKDSRPDSFSFNAVINAFTRSRQKDAGRRAESVLDRFLEHSEEFPKVRLDARSFIHIVSYYGRMGKDMLDAPYRAEYVLNRMIALFKSGHEEVAPNVFAFTTVMDSYSHHKHPDAGVCAERLMRQMEKLKANYNANKLEINTGVMNCVLLAWASCGDENAGQRAQTHLENMERQYHQAGRTELRPNEKTYGLVLNAWSKSGNFDKAQRALDILEHMKEEHKKGALNVGPSEHAYSLVINACAFTNSGLDSEAHAFKIAIRVMKELIASAELEPSSLTYGWFFQACGRLRVPDHLKDPSIEVAFLRCCERGLMNDFVLNRLKGAATETLFRKLMGPVASEIPKYDQSKEKLKQRLLVQHLPREWKFSRPSYESPSRSPNFRP